MEAPSYVSHLIGADLTRIDAIGERPQVKRVPFPAAPLNSKPGEPDRRAVASLAYTLIPSPDYRKIYVPRHALGAYGWRTWNGRPVVDVLLTAGDTPLAQPTNEELRCAGSKAAVMRSDPTVTGPGVRQPPAFVQPRAAIYRKRDNALLVAGEGDSVVAVSDGVSVDPSANVLGWHHLSAIAHEIASGRKPTVKVPRGFMGCLAPSGIALSADESRQYVYCRSTNTLVDIDKGAVILATDPLNKTAARGRRLFYQADNPSVAEGFGCAGCHPEGRDDGHVWRDLDGLYHAFPMRSGESELIEGKRRQTPMLAGRLSKKGPFGWRGEVGSLPLQILVGFGKHRWTSDPQMTSNLAAAKALGAFLLEGLVPPPPRTRPDSPEVKRGEELFMDASIGCSTCHTPDTGYTSGNTALLSITNNKTERFRTPSLRHVAGTPPYYHDGSVATLGQLVDNIGDDMGFTSGLSADDRAALVSFLETL